jgi:hypothetical protein
MMFPLSLAITAEVLGEIPEVASGKVSKNDKNVAAMELIKH